MVKKTILCAVVFFVVYSVFVAKLAPNWWAATQSTKQENIIKAQNYIYNAQTSKYVIVGSSLSNRIQTDSLPNTTNLAFGGQSAYDGLYIITHKPALPKVVLIEMNLVFRNGDDEFTSALFSPLTFYPRKKIAALRADKAPIAVFGQIAVDGIYKLKDLIRGYKRVQHPVMFSGTHELSDKMLRSAYLSMFKLPATPVVNNAVTTLKQYVNELEKKNISVVFFEMPIDNQLEQLPLPVFIRKTFYQNFPQAKYTYITRPLWPYCDTFDGQHLEQQQAAIYTQYLKKNMLKF